jgi:hypothetical protein
MTPEFLPSTRHGFKQLGYPIGITRSRIGQLAGCWPPRQSRNVKGMTACPTTRDRNSGRPSEARRSEGTRGQRPPAPLRASCASNDPRTEAQRSVSTAKATRRRFRSAFHIFRMGGLVDPARLCTECCPDSTPGARSHTAASSTGRAAPYLRRWFQVRSPNDQVCSRPTNQTDPGRGLGRRPTQVIDVGVVELTEATGGSGRTRVGRTPP